VIENNWTDGKFQPLSPSDQHIAGLFKKRTSIHTKWKEGLVGHSISMGLRPIHQSVDFQIVITSIKKQSKMKTRISATLLIALLTLFSSCDHDTIHAHGEVTSVYHDIEGYSRLRVSDAFQVYVHFSEVEEEIRIAANDNLHEKIVVEKDGDELVIRLK